MSQEDFIRDGILYCGVCGYPKQAHIKNDLIDEIIPIWCSCDRSRAQSIQEQIEHRENKAKLRRLRSSSMMAHRYREARFEAYNIRPENQLAYSVAMNYCGDWNEMKRKNQGLLFYGPVGTGKTYTAACIANFLLERCVPVVMTSFVQILRGVEDRYSEHFTEALNNAALLIIDDLGAERGTEYALETVYWVIDSRIRVNKPMILTTNEDLDEMIHCKEIRYKRIYDRILEHCFPVEIPGLSFREDEAARRYEEMKAEAIGKGM